MQAHEVNFDGLVGPTHHYAGLSFGNQASMQHQGQASNPKRAALQGLAKMQALSELGFIQGVLAPQERPHLPTLRRLGFYGTDQQVIYQAMQQAPELLSALSSASAMWAANAATVAPSADSLDRRVHFTVANLNHKFHRAIEHPSTAKILAAMFSDPTHFVHHAALPSVSLLGDEGAGNHNRLGGAYGSPAIHMFVYGAPTEGGQQPQRYPARQTLAASQAVARLHQLCPTQTMFVQQNPAAIDQGVFHNDVIAVSNQQVLFYHEQAFLHRTQVLTELAEKMQALGHHLLPIEVPAARVSMADAVQSYLFNSQLLSLADGAMALILPVEAREQAHVWSYLQELLSMNTPIQHLKVFDLRESMQNGGGPACLRLRVVLTEAELQAVNPQVLWDARLGQKLQHWVERHYRDRLQPHDLADPQLLLESRTALDELTQLLGLGSVYEFQQL